MAPHFCNHQLGSPIKWVFVQWKAHFIAAAAASTTHEAGPPHVPSEHPATARGGELALEMDYGQGGGGFRWGSGLLGGVLGDSRGK